MGKLSKKGSATASIFCHQLELIVISANRNIRSENQEFPPSTYLQKVYDSPAIVLQRLVHLPRLSMNYQWELLLTDHNAREVDDCILQNAERFVEIYGKLNIRSWNGKGEAKRLIVKMIGVVFDETLG